MKTCPLCGRLAGEIGEFRHIKIYGLSVDEILHLREFYICHTGDTKLEKIRDRSIEKGFEG